MFQRTLTLMALVAMLATTNVYAYSNCFESKDDIEKQIKKKQAEVDKAKKAFDKAVKHGAKLKKSKPSSKKKHLKKVKELAEKYKKLKAELDALKKKLEDPDSGEGEGEVDAGGEGCVQSLGSEY